MLKRPATLSSVNEKISLISKYIPWTYHWIINKELDKYKTILDIGCGNGSFMYMFNQNKNYEITGVDIFKPSVMAARRTGIYKRVLAQDIRKLNFNKKSFDMAISNHVIEHLNKQDGFKLLKDMENMAKKKVIVITPMGEFEQDEYGGNKYQKHKSSWYSQDFIKLGYRVIGQGLNIYNRNKLLNSFLNIIGPLNNVFFLFHVLLQPFLATRYKYCHQLICVKEING